MDKNNVIGVIIGLVAAILAFIILSNEFESDKQD